MCLCLVYSLLQAQPGVPGVKDGFRYATLPKTASRQNGAARVAAGPPPCLNSTFYSHLPAPAGEKIILKALQTLPGGDFIGAGSITLPNGDREGLLFRMDNTGVLVNQQQLRINGLPVSMEAMRTTLAGNIVVAGLLRDGSNGAFVAQLDGSFAPAWVQTFALPSAPLKLTMDVVNGETAITLAAQLSASVSYALLQMNGSFSWKKEVPVAGLTGLVGFTWMNTPMGLTANITIAGKQQTLLLQVDPPTGNITSAATMGDGSTETRYTAVTAFNGRMNLLGLVKTATGFGFIRNTAYASTVSETEHVWRIPGTIDFGASAAMDVASEALGLCLPQDGALVFIKNFAYAGSPPQFTRRYIVPVGASMAGVTRSADGGFLFALNTAAGDELLLVKTDSLGMLPGCGYQDIGNQFQEAIMKNNVAATATGTTSSYTAAAAALSSSAAALSPVYDCNQHYCPLVPGADDCLDSYFKTFRSNSYIDLFTSYFLMGNYNQIVLTRRYDRLTGDLNTVTTGLKLFDEKGRFVKGVTIFVDGASGAIVARKMDDKSIMLVCYTTRGGIPCYTFVLVSDDLQVLWTQSIMTFAGYDFMNAGVLTGDVYKDQEGNYYYVGTRPGVFSTPGVLVYKMDASGNQLWLKAYQLSKGDPYMCTATFTPTSIVVLAEGGSGGLTVRLDKATGQALNGYQYQNKWNGSGYTRLAQYDGDRIFFAGDNNSGNFLMGLFDSTGRPTRLRTINNSASYRAGAVKNGSMYASYVYYNGSASKETLLKVDTGLNIVFKNDYDWNGGYATGMGIGDNGCIYTGGSYYWGGTSGAYADGMLIKYDNHGLRGACSYSSPPVSVTDVDPQPTALSFQPLQRSFQPISVQVDFVPDAAGQQISAVVCSSASLCSNVKVAGPDKICLLNQPYRYKAQKTCGLFSLWGFDTAYVSVRSNTDSVLDISFKKSGSTWIKAKLDANCQTYWDSIQVQVQGGGATLSLGGNASLCPGDSLLLSAGPAFSSYQWQDGSTGDSLQVKLPGKYYVQVNDVCGTAFSDTAYISAAPLPPLQIAGDTIVCVGDTLLLQGSSGFNVYSWTPAPLQSSFGGQQVKILPQQGQLVRLRAVTTLGCRAADSVLTGLKAARPVSLGKDTSFCSYDSLQLTAGKDYAQYSWSTGSTLPSITVRNAGPYWVHALDTNGCRAADTMAVTQVFAAPTPALGKDRPLCEGTTLVLDAGSYSSYQWQDGTTGEYYNVSIPGSYRVQVTDSHQCSAADTILIKDVVPSPAGFLAATDSICQYGQRVIAPKEYFVSYSWSTGSFQPTITIDRPGSYSLQVEDSNGCKGGDTILVVQKECLAGVFIPNAFTPDGKGGNEVFRALVYGNVISFRLQVYNRFGEPVFATTDPMKGWDGTCKGRPQDPGTFVWMCSYHLEGSSAVMKKGTVILIR